MQRYLLILNRGVNQYKSLTQDPQALSPTPHLGICVADPSLCVCVGLCVSVCMYTSYCFTESTSLKGFLICHCLKSRSREVGSVSVQKYQVIPAVLRLNTGGPLCNIKKLQSGCLEYSSCFINVSL